MGLVHAEGQKESTAAFAGVGNLRPATQKGLKQPVTPCVYDEKQKEKRRERIQRKQVKCISE